MHLRVEIPLQFLVLYLVLGTLLDLVLLPLVLGALPGIPEIIIPPSAVKSLRQLLRALIWLSLAFVLWRLR